MVRAGKLLLLAVWMVLCASVAWGFQKLNMLSWRDRVSCWCHGGVLRIIGVHLKVQGEVSHTRPLLLVSNHLSYLDIPLLGSVFPFRFTPKSDIESWPVMGWMCKVTSAIFIERRVEKFRESMEKIREALSAGEAVSLFPEATTGNGIRLVPFKSGLFSLADAPIGEEELIVQPAAIIYTRIRNLPLGKEQWPLIAWYGDMTLSPHLWGLMGLGRIDVTIEFLKPVKLREYGDRKRLAEHCQKAIEEAIQNTREKL